jgi:hypothetical protein
MRLQLWSIDEGRLLGRGPLYANLTDQKRVITHYGRVTIRRERARVSRRRATCLQAPPSPLSVSLMRYLALSGELWFRTSG